MSILTDATDTAYTTGLERFSAWDLLAWGQVSGTTYLILGGVVAWHARGLWDRRSDGRKVGGWIPRRKLRRIGDALAAVIPESFGGRQPDDPPLATEQWWAAIDQGPLRVKQGKTVHLRGCRHIRGEVEVLWACTPDEVRALADDDGLRLCRTCRPDQETAPVGAAEGEQG